MPRSREKEREPRQPGDPLWVHIAYSKQDDRNIACTLTSNVSFERGVDYYDMKIYATGNTGRVYDQFRVSPGGTIHLDVYSNGGEGSGLINADFRVTEQAVEVVKSREIEVTASPASMLIEQVQAIPTPCNGYRIYGDIWLRFGNELELVARSLDEEITGEDAVRFASMTDEEMYQAVINLYMSGDIDNDEYPVYIGDCPPPELEAEAITSTKSVERHKPGKPGISFFKQK